jgi:multiple sugar transport system permease protein
MTATFAKRKKRIGLLFASPMIIFLLALVAIPIYLGIRTSFNHDVLSDFQIHPAGFENFRKLLSDPSFWHSLRFTVIYSVVVTAIEVILGVLLAIGFDRKFPGKRLLFSLTLVPIMIAPSLMAVMFRLILNENIGIVPYALNKLKLHYSIFSQSNIFISLVILDVLEFTSFTFLLSYSALQNVPKEIYEAASIDGASKSRTYKDVVLPMLKPVLSIVLILRLLDSIRTFDTVYILTGGGPGDRTQTIGIYIYKMAFINGNFGIAAAASVILVLLLTPFIPSIIKRFSLERQR